jgi:uncharacterized protein YjdB
LILIRVPTASSGLPVSYTSSAPLIASVEGTTAGSQKIKVRAAGQVTITASQAGNTAYDASADANQTFTVGYYNLFADSLPGLKALAGRKQCGQRSFVRRHSE